MQVQNMVWAPAVITVLTALANVPINMILIAWYDFWGAALATSVARILQLALLCGELPPVNMRMHSLSRCFSMSSWGRACMPSSTLAACIAWCTSEAKQCSRLSQCDAKPRVVSSVPLSNVLTAIQAT